MSTSLVLAPAHVRETYKEGMQRRVNDANNEPPEDLPVFEATAANVSAFVGRTTYLPCRVRNLGDKVVSLFLSLHILRFASRLAVITRETILHDDLYSGDIRSAVEKAR